MNILAREMRGARPALRRYFKYVREEMLKNFSTGTQACSMPLALPRLVELVRTRAPHEHPPESVLLRLRT